MGEQPSVCSTSAAFWHQKGIRHLLDECSVPLSVGKLATLCWAPEHAHKLEALREKSSHCNFKQQLQAAGAGAALTTWTSLKQKHRQLR